MARPSDTWVVSPFFFFVHPWLRLGEMALVISCDIGWLPTYLGTWYLHDGPADVGPWYSGCDEVSYCTM